MTVEVTPVAAAQLPTFMTTHAPAIVLDERWAAWRGKGLIHDRAVRRMVAVATAPISIIVVAVAVYVLLGR